MISVNGDSGFHRYDNAIAATIATMIFLPVFFQIEGGIFRDDAIIFDSYGLITRVPLPLSVVACLIGIPLIGRFRSALIAFAFVFSSLVLMLVSVLLTADFRLQEAQPRLIMLLQFLLPMFALVLGQLYERIDGRMYILSKVFFIALFTIITAQFVCSWYQYNGFTIFTPYLYVFSIYQHLQYVPVVFISAFVLILFTFASSKIAKGLPLFFIPVMVMYIIVATSLIGMFLFAIGSLLYFMFYVRFTNTGTMIKLAGMVILILLLAFGYLYHYRGELMLEAKLNFSATNNTNGIEIPGIQKRLGYWKHYGESAAKDVRSFLAGNSAGIQRGRFPSAHNYYLDLIYHFGFISICPLLMLLGYTLRAICRERKRMVASPELLGVATVVLFILLIDNSLKVGLRQPYPGIFTFFLWGILISRLSLFPGKDCSAK